MQWFSIHVDTEEGNKTDIVDSEWLISLWSLLAADISLVWYQFALEQEL